MGLPPLPPAMQKNMRKQSKKGRLAGRILLCCLADGVSPKFENMKERLAWEEMHPSAHMWAALMALYPHTETIYDVEDFEASAFLLLAERLCDKMQARDDLRHPDPWRCSPKMREKLEQYFTEKAA